MFWLHLLAISINVTVRYIQSVQGLYKLTYMCFHSNGNAKLVYFSGDALEKNLFGIQSDKIAIIIRSDTYMKEIPSPTICIARPGTFVPEKNHQSPQC